VFDALAASWMPLGFTAPLASVNWLVIVVLSGPYGPAVPNSDAPAYCTVMALLTSADVKVG
jgi:hypothetical protein